MISKWITHFPVVFTTSCCFFGVFLCVSYVFYARLFYLLIVRFHASNRVEHIQISSTHVVYVLVCLLECDGSVQGFCFIFKYFTDSFRPFPSLCCCCTRAGLCTLANNCAPIIYTHIICTHGYFNKVVRRKRREKEEEKKQQEITQ